MQTFLLFLFFLLINLVLINLERTYIKKSKIYDKKNKKISLYGGVILVINILIIYLLKYLNFVPNEKIYFLGILFLILSFFLIGILDDKLTLPPILRLISLSIIIFLFLKNFDQYIIKQFYFSNKNITFFENVNYQILFTIFCILAFTNALNFFDGINLQVSLYSFFFIIYLLSKQSSFFLSIILISLLFFIYLNFNNKSYLGDNGVYVLSIILSLFSIHFHNEKLIFADEIIYLMFIPGIDMIRLFFERIKKKRSPLLGDQNHIHYFFKKKFSKNYLLYMLVVTFVPIMSYQILSNTIIMFFILSLMYFLLIKIVRKNET